MKNTILMTGYPGFLARNLIDQLIQDHGEAIEHFYLLVLPELHNEASQTIYTYAHKHGLNPDLFSMISGDITKQGLALEAEVDQKLNHSVTHVFHLAAIYDLAVPKDIAYHVNVNGTMHVNDWVQTLTNLERYIYFSTAYVSGKREGRIYEHELAEGQDFRNHYEQTKYEAELLVNALKDTVPLTIIRPGVVKGNSETGQTIKFDGLYFMLNYLENTRYLPINVYFGEGKPEGNFVPSDYILQATSYLSISAVGEGKTYHLTDPNPYTMKELQQLLSEHYMGKPPKGKLPVSLGKTMMKIKPIRKMFQVETEVLDYFLIDSSYDCTQTTKDLEGTGISCPDLKDTLPSMISFYRKYKDDYRRHIQIN